MTWMKKGRLAYSERQNDLVNSANEFTVPKVFYYLITYSAKESEQIVLSLGFQNRPIQFIKSMTEVKKAFQ